MLIDKFNRIHTYLRISLTDSCNMRCTYCMPLSYYKGTDSKKLMTVGEIFEIAKIFVSQGITKIRLTGGEPLIRKEFKEIVAALNTLPVKLAITTNGLMIDKFIDTLKRNNVNEINVSLDSLDAATFERITQNGKFKKILDNINLLLSQNFHVKLNTVLIKSVKQNDILKLIEWTKHSNLEVRFIEFMPFAKNNWDMNEVITYTQVIESISNRYEIEKIPEIENATSKMYRVKGYQGKFGFITTVSNPFCESCNRLRLTADGKLKNCLFATNETDLLTAYRNGEDILPLINTNVSKKYASLGGLKQLHENDTRSMIGIGG